MEEEIGKTAGAIWQALSTQGGLSLTRLKNQVKARAPRLRLGHRLAGARRPDCDSGREALFPNPHAKATGALLGLIVFPGENKAKAC